MHINMSKDKRCLITFITFVIFTILDIFHYIYSFSLEGFSWFELFTFVFTILLSCFLFFALLKKEQKPLLLIYIIFKTYDGIIAPVIGLLDLNLSGSYNWAEVAYGIMYTICAFALFFTVLLLIIHQFTDNKYAHFAIEILTLIAIISALGCVIFASINTIIYSGSPLEIVASLTELILYIGLYELSPLMHSQPGEKEN